MSAGTYDLTTVTDLKAWLAGAPSDTSFDAQFQALITAASLFIQRYCNRTFLIQSYTENRNGNGKRSLLLKNYPIQGVSSVTVNGTPIPTVTDQVSSGFFVPDADNTGLLQLRGWEFCKGVQNVQIQYQAGYFLNVAAASASEVGWACRELCNQKWKKRARPDVVAETLMGAATQSFSQKDVPPEVCTVLDQYMNPAIPLG